MHNGWSAWLFGKVKKDKVDDQAGQTQYSQHGASHHHHHHHNNNNSNGNNNSLNAPDGIDGTGGSPIIHRRVVTMHPHLHLHHHHGQQAPPPILHHQMQPHQMQQQQQQQQPSQHHHLGQVQQSQQPPMHAHPMGMQPPLMQHPMLRTPYYASQHAGLGAQSMGDGSGSGGGGGGSGASDKHASGAGHRSMLVVVASTLVIMYVLYQFMMMAMGTTNSLSVNSSSSAAAAAVAAAAASGQSGDAAVANAAAAAAAMAAKTHRRPTFGKPTTFTMLRIGFNVNNLPYPMATYFDKVFVVNDGHRIDRWWRTVAYMKSFNLNLERFVAVNAETDKTLADRWPKYSKWLAKWQRDTEAAAEQAAVHAAEQAAAELAAEVASRNSTNTKITAAAIMKRERQPIDTMIRIQHGSESTQHASHASFSILHSREEMAKLLTLRNVITQARTRRLKRVLIMDDDVMPHTQMLHIFSRILSDHMPSDAATNWKLLFLAVRQKHWSLPYVSAPPSEDSYHVDKFNRTLGYVHMYNPTDAVVFALQEAAYTPMLKAINRVLTPWTSKKSPIGPFRRVCEFQFADQCFALVPSLFNGVDDLDNQRRDWDDHGGAPPRLALELFGHDTYDFFTPGVLTFEDLIPREHTEVMNRMWVGENVPTEARRFVGSLWLPPLISVIMTAYEAESTLDMSMSSIINQTYPNIEIVIVDDASGPRTRRKLREMLARSQTRAAIKLIENKIRKGAYPSRNVAVSHSQGQIIAFQDADDYSMPERIEMQAKPILSGQASLTLSEFVRTHRESFNWHEGSGEVRRQVEESRQHFRSTIGYRKAAPGPLCSTAPRHGSIAKFVSQRVAEITSHLIKSEVQVHQSCCRARVAFITMVLTREAFYSVGEFAKTAMSGDSEWMERFLAHTKCWRLSGSQNVYTVMDSLFTRIGRSYLRINKVLLVALDKKAGLSRTTPVPAAVRLHFRKKYRETLRKRYPRCSVLKSLSYNDPRQLTMSNLKEKQPAMVLNGERDNILISPELLREIKKTPMWRHVVKSLVEHLFEDSTAAKKKKQRETKQHKAEALAKQLKEAHQKQHQEAEAEPPSPTLPPPPPTVQQVTTATLSDQPPREKSRPLSLSSSDNAAAATAGASAAPAKSSKATQASKSTSKKSGSAGSTRLIKLKSKAKNPVATRANNRVGKRSKRNPARKHDKQQQKNKKQQQKRKHASASKHSNSKKASSTSRKP
eukprot:TRINITY_DN66391_c8_g2_i1.p1 TRINITY_DN66391_c8_g2~~TRINITY_DN66391_c8_g2_i1.p1  ORF type:complete len:1220 (-),score=568.11 TRINITY_DN66391_c8_g2_i1:3160-6819(-)